MLDIAAKRGITPQQVFFRFVIDIGIVPLTGTTSDVHMKQDLAVLDMPPLAVEEVDAIRNLMSKDV